MGVRPQGKYSSYPDKIIGLKKQFCSKGDTSVSESWKGALWILEFKYVSVHGQCAVHSTIISTLFIAIESHWAWLSTLLRIHEILVRIRIRGSIPLTNGSRSGSCYFRKWPTSAICINTACHCSVIKYIHRSRDATSLTNNEPLLNRLKGTQEWEFFWLRFWILSYFIVSYA